jgi:hypothetical protein
MYTCYYVHRGNKIHCLTFNSEYTMHCRSLDPLLIVLTILRVQTREPRDGWPLLTVETR